MNVKDFFNIVQNMTKQIIQFSGLDMISASEQERQIVGAYCFGVINGYVFEKKIDVVHVHAVMIDILIELFEYSPNVAAQFCDFLIQCTDEKFHPSVNSIIHRGMEGYYQLKNGKKEYVKIDIKEIMETVRKYAD